MIPYENIEYRDWSMYWSRCCMFTREFTGEWESVLPKTRRMEYVTRVDEDGHEFEDEQFDLIYDPHLTLEQLAARDLPLYFTRDAGGEEVRVDALTPFQSTDWITYCPKLGYYVVDGKLLLLQNTAPRRTHKGIHPNRIEVRSPVRLKAEVPLTVPAASHIWEGIIEAVVTRLNNPLPVRWDASLLVCIREERPVVLDTHTAAIPLKGIGAALLQRGHAAGQVTADQSDVLSFTPHSEDDEFALSMYRLFRAKVGRI